MTKQRLDLSEPERQSLALLAASRFDHEPSVFERAAVRQALSARITTTQSTLGGRLAPHKLWLGGACVSVIVLCGLAALYVTEHSPTTMTRAAAAVHPPSDFDLPDAQPRVASFPAAPAPELNAEQRSGVSDPAAPAPDLQPPAAGTNTAAAAPSVVVRAVSTRTRAFTAQQTPPSRRARLAPDAETEVAAHANAANGPSAPKPQLTEPVAQSAQSAQPARVAARSGEELAWMRQIHQALRRGELRVAVDLCTGHAQRWPDGLFALEREGVRIATSCQLRAADGQNQARAFLAEHPNSAISPRVRQKCGFNAAAGGDIRTP